MPLLGETYKGKLPREVLKGYSRERYLLVVPQIKQLAAAIVNSPDPYMEEIGVEHWNGDLNHNKLCKTFAMWAGNTEEELDKG